MQDLKLIVDCAKKLDFRGQDSITRLNYLNSMAHKAALEAINCGEENIDFEEDQISPIERFIINRYSLKCLYMLTGKNCKIGFEKIKQRLVDDISFFLEREKGSSFEKYFSMAN